MLLNSFLFFFTNKEQNLKKYGIIVIEVDDMKILLIVDDSSIITTFASKMFKDEYNVIVAKNGNEVIEVIRNNFDSEFVGMFLDLNMPVCNGFQVLEVFKTNNLFNKIPVCILTGDDTKDSIDKVFNYPIVDVLNKPFNEKEIRICLEKMILRK